MSYIKIGLRSVRREEFFKDARGNVGIIFGLMTVPVVVLAGMAIDFHRAETVRHNLQAAVDASALAGSALTDATDGARAGASTVMFNSWAPGALGQGITGGTAIGKDTVTVSVATDVPTTVGSLLGIKSLHVEAKAVSIIIKAPTKPTVTSARACLLALDPNSSDGLHIQGNNTLRLANCWASVDATTPTSINANGNSSTAVATGFCTAGGNSIPNGNFSPEPVSCPATADPFATISAYPSADKYVPNFTPPATGGACAATSLNLKKGTYTLSPGRYCGGITLMAQAKVTLKPGVYIIDSGELQLLSGSQTTGTGVVFYFRGDGATLDIQGGASATLTGRDSNSSYPGMLFVQDPQASAGSSSLITGGGTINMSGLLYMPTQRIEWRGNGDINANSEVFAMIAKDFYMRGTGTFYAKASNTASIPDASPAVTLPSDVTHLIQ